MATCPVALCSTPSAPKLNTHCIGEGAPSAKRAVMTNADHTSACTSKPIASGSAPSAAISWRARASASAAVGTPCGGVGAGAAQDSSTVVGSSTVAGGPGIDVVVPGRHPDAPARCAHGAEYHHEPWASLLTISDGAVPSVGPTFHVVPS